MKQVIFSAIVALAIIVTLRINVLPNSNNIKTPVVQSCPGYLMVIVMMPGYYNYLSKE